MTPRTGEPAPTRGSTPPYPVEFQGTSFDSTHLELTDSYTRFKEEHDVLGREFRSEVVCPGLAHNGNECSIDSTIGSTGRDRTDFGMAVQFHESAGVFSVIPADRWTRMDPVNGVEKFSGHTDHGGSPVERTTDVGYGDYSIFFAYTRHITRNHRQGNRLVAAEYSTYAGALGDLYRGYPSADQGGATWRGATVGTTRAEGTRLNGNALLEYDFSDDTLDLTLDQIAATDPGASYTGPSSFVWEALQANADGSFYIPGHGNDKPDTSLHPTLGYVDGDFYGPNAAEFGGVFEREGVVGAFGGKRVPE